MTLSIRRRAFIAYAVGALGLLLTIVVAFALPTMVSSPCPQQLDCFKQLNTTKTVLVVLCLLLASSGFGLGVFRSYLAEH